MKVLITGTHLTTAMAVIEEFKKQKNIEIVYVGRKTTREGDPSQSIESQILPKIGVKFIPITSGRLQRAFTIYTIPSIIKIPVGFIQAFWILLSEKPDVVLSFGGYVSIPIVITSWLFSIPIIIHEQTLVTGLANKINAWFADKVAVSFSDSELAKNKKAILTGNPLRNEVIQGVSVTHPGDVVGRHPDKPLILVTGGNQGSHVINLAIEGCLDKLLEVASVIHQTGDSKYKDFEKLKTRESENYKVEKWIDNMGEVMKKVDLVISRAGINTLTEVAILGKPTIVIPLPYLYADEQNKNAKYFEKLGLVKILPQSKLNSDILLKEIKSALIDLNNFRESAKNAKEVIIPNAAQRLTLETILLVKKV